VESATTTNAPTHNHAWTSIHFNPTSHSRRH
jgi:hypothetical protein